MSERHFQIEYTDNRGDDHWIDAQLFDQARVMTTADNLLKAAANMEEGWGSIETVTVREYEPDPKFPHGGFICVRCWLFRWDHQKGQVVADEVVTT